jgi:adenylate kinase
MRIVLLGAPGAGKGTQGRMLAAHFSIPQIATGDILRLAVREGTELGLAAKAYMDAGNLVPDGVMIGIIKDRLALPDAAPGFVLDGFPRTVPQAEALDVMLASIERDLQLAIDVQVPEDVLVVRLSGRRVCRECGATYHERFSPTKDGVSCDVCGGELYQRADDAAGTVRNRLAVYHRQTQPIVARYASKGLLRVLNGDQDMAAVRDALLSVLDDKKVRS